MPTVSILVPSYNHARYLNACLDSVQKQSFADWELILVDDGSTDGSVEQAERWAAEEGRIQVHRNPANLGTYGTEQRALDMAQGEFVAILNSDDVWEPTKLGRQVEAIRKWPEGRFCFTLGWEVDTAGQIFRGSDIHRDWPTSEQCELLPYLLYENRILASSVLFRREGLRFETTCRYSGDWVALLRLAEEGPAICVPERLTLWRIHEANTFRRSAGQVLEEIRVRQAIARDPERWFRLRLDPELVSFGIAMNALNLQALAVMCGFRRLANQASKQAFRYHPQKRKHWKRYLAGALPLSILRKKLWKDEVIDIEPSAISSLPSLAL